MRTGVCLVPQMWLLSSMKLQPKGTNLEAVIGNFQSMWYVPSKAGDIPVA